MVHSICDGSDDGTEQHIKKNPPIFDKPGRTFSMTTTTTTITTVCHDLRRILCVYKRPPTMRLHRRSYSRPVIAHRCSASNVLAAFRLSTFDIQFTPSTASVKSRYFVLPAQLADAILVRTVSYFYDHLRQANEIHIYILRLRHLQPSRSFRWKPVLSSISPTPPILQRRLRIFL